MPNGSDQILTVSPTSSTQTANNVVAASNVFADILENQVLVIVIFWILIIGWVILLFKALGDIKKRTYSSKAARIIWYILIIGFGYGGIILYYLFGRKNDLILR